MGRIHAFLEQCHAFFAKWKPEIESLLSLCYLRLLRLLSQLSPSRATGHFIEKKNC